MNLKGPSKNVTLEYYHNLNRDSPEVYLDNLLDIIKNHLLCNPYMQDSIVFKLSDLRLQISHSKPNLGGAEKDDSLAIRRMLEKLIRDGFVSELELSEDLKKLPEVKGEKFFYLAYEGFCFEGYTKQKKDKELEAKKVQTISNWQLILTAILAAGTIGLVLVDFFKK